MIKTDGATFDCLIYLVVCLLFVAFHYLVSEVVFLRCENGYYILLNSGYEMSCLLSLILYYFPFCCSATCPIIVPCVHGALSSHCANTVDPVGKRDIFMSVWLIV